MDGWIYFLYRGDAVNSEAIEAGGIFGEKRASRGEAVETPGQDSR